ncbi:MAG: M42 family peptidase, partial [Kiritimatiellia bacterium]
LDEIALVVSRIEPDGRLRVVKSGGMMPHKMGERLVDILGDKDVVPGVVSFGAGHVSPNGQAMTWDDCFVMTGLSEPQLRDAGVHEGAAMVPIRAGRGPVLLGDPGDPLLAAWTFDDRMGVVTLLRLLEEIKR